MAEVVEQAQHDFWRPPVQIAPPASAEHVEMVEACQHCRSEFIVGSRYCHTCGTARPNAVPASRSERREVVSRVLGTAMLMNTAILSAFTGIGERLGLSTAAFMAFLAGAVCAVCALGVGIIFSARTVLDWQAVQLWRIEWLLGAVAAFCAGCLLKRAR